MIKPACCCHASQLWLFGNSATIGAITRQADLLDQLLLLKLRIVGSA